MAGIVFEDGIAGRAAAEILAFQEGALVLWRLDPETVDLRALYETYLRRLLPERPELPER